MSRFLPAELNERYERAQTPDEQKAARIEIDTYYAGGKEEYDRKTKAKDAFFTLQAESDRAIAITWAAILEDEIRASIAKKLSPSEDFMPVLKKTFESQGALSSFSSVIDFGGLLSLYNKEVWQNLSTIRKIRNIFAHHIDVSLFNDAIVASNCAKLTLVERFVSTDQDYVYVEMPSPLGPVAKLGYALNAHPLGTMKLRFSTTCHFIWSALQNTYAGEVNPCLHW